MRGGGEWGDDWGVGRGVGGGEGGGEGVVSFMALIPLVAISTLVRSR